ncbi:MAG: hypothetical protein F6K41_06095 [Symploca sp. SIO3E6]|nr:hypothetical protein [Caldora sp. SIO3E6]
MSVFNPPGICQLWIDSEHSLDKQKTEKPSSHHFQGDEGRMKTTLASLLGEHRGVV